MAGSVVIQDNGTVIIKNLNDEASRVLIDEIHGKENFGKRLFCNGFIPLTPKKKKVSTGPKIKEDENASSTQMLVPCQSVRLGSEKKASFIFLFF